MFINPPHEIDIEIDGLTDSIVCCKTDTRYETKILKLEEQDLKRLQMRKGWKFDWSIEYGYADRQVYKLVIAGKEKIIQGVVSCRPNYDHFIMHTIESAPANIGKKKKYRGVAGNLVAYVCKLSLDHGYNGVILFTPKTNLVEHYIETLNAVIFRDQKMVIFEEAAQTLINKYFPT
ncbi:hypothetical protein [Chitinophaga sp. Cy-1792]|uniref:hypothetical protein n=1 Tax=Chitinophaga sp. Cy-1792 TaxID=2608339 RepID=UPI00141E5AEA|nr:hypothetical protein [Chitinophaga sp. Cy-1792]NIG57210.1 hypothetical protein [Chitinophaga sp. Cy-1792]